MAKPVVHFEIGCRDKLKTNDFFSKLFDWEIDQGPMGTIAPGPGGIGGHITSLGHEPHNYVTVYVEVEEFAAISGACQRTGRQNNRAPDRSAAGQLRMVCRHRRNVLGLWKPKK